jgi:peptidoglycan/xylan/chitin deacetylase (PgdA/CDA1 family)
MNTSSVGTVKKIKLAVTVDDLFQWKGTPELPSYEFTTITRRMTTAFASHGIREIYAFSNTAPTENTSLLSTVYDHWSEEGHYVGNHTHAHASLNWLTPEVYIGDIEKTEALISKWSDIAPTRYFRFCMDMWGDTPEKRGEVTDYLAQAGYEAAPISLWFYDAQFSFAYLRALLTDDTTAIKWLREKYVETAVKQCRVQAAAAKLMFRRDPIHIWLIHGTAIASDCLQAILDAFADAGVEFVSLEEAMCDPMNQQQPIVTPAFRNQVQKWAEAKGVVIEDCPPAILAELDSVAPIPGMSEVEIMEGMGKFLAQEFGIETDNLEFSLQ